MPERWLILNFVTGKEAPLPEAAKSNEPTQAWCEGWEAAMYDIGYGINPYPDSTLEYHDWQEGWEAAEGD